MKLTVLHNAVAEDAGADDLDVLAQATVVCRALDALGHRAEIVPVDLDLGRLARRLSSERPHAIVNLVESLGGDDRGILHVPALLATLGIPFTGASLQAVMMTTHKPVAKRLLRDAGLPTPDWFAPGDPEGAALSLLGQSVIVKPQWDHGSRGLDAVDVRLFEDVEALHEAVSFTPVRGERFAECYVDGREFNLALLTDGRGDVQALPPAEMTFRDWDESLPRIVGYRAKWDESSHEFANTVRRFDFPAEDAALLERMRLLALDAWRYFGMSGYARVDFRVDAAGEPTILELNANPCLNPDAGFAAALERAEIDFEDAVGRILADART